MCECLSTPIFPRLMCQQDLYKTRRRKRALHPEKKVFSWLLFLRQEEKGAGKRCHLEKKRSDGVDKEIKLCALFFFPSFRETDSLRSRFLSPFNIRERRRIFFFFLLCLIERNKTSLTSKMCGPRKLSMAKVHFILFKIEKKKDFRTVVK